MNDLCQCCGYFSCICQIRIIHKDSCKFRKAAEMKIGISCIEHDKEVCLICDKCNCDKI